MSITPQRIFILFGLILLIGAGITSCKRKSPAGTSYAVSTTAAISPNASANVIDTNVPKIPTGFGITPIQPGVWGSDPFCKDGEELHRYPNGLIRTQGNYVKGKRDGPWYSFYPNGKPWSETSFTDGHKDGSTKTWFENGKVRYTGAYKMDVPKGKWTYYEETGKVAKVENK